MDQTTKPNLNWVTKTSYAPSFEIEGHKVEMPSHQIDTAMGRFKILRDINYQWKIKYPVLTIEIGPDQIEPEIKTEYKIENIASLSEGKFKAYMVLQNSIQRLIDAQSNVVKGILNAGK